LKEVLEQGQFAVTVEYNPPKGTNINGVLDNAKQLLGRVHGVNVTDNTAAVVRAGSLPVCRLLYELGHDPVMQLTCRDRNRIAIQSDLMGAHLLARRLWERLRFKELAVLPGVVRKNDGTYQDAVIMFRSLL
jgi:5,10-methylenetetrahydrofolate reductase